MRSSFHPFSIDPSVLLLASNDCSLFCVPCSLRTLLAASSSAVPLAKNLICCACTHRCWNRFVVGSVWQSIYLPFGNFVFFFAYIYCLHLTLSEMLDAKDNWML